jgi:hypothetical protein
MHASRPRMFGSYFFVEAESIEVMPEYVCVGPPVATATFRCLGKGGPVDQPVARQLILRFISISRGLDEFVRGRPLGGFCAQVEGIAVG